jgi:hypothetical protein
MPSRRTEMPSVMLSREWTDPKGNRHPSGSVLEVDDVTAARLQAEGSGRIAPSKAPRAGDGTEWVGPSGGKPGAAGKSDRVGPSGGKPAAGDGTGWVEPEAAGKARWVGPSGGQP